MSFRDKESLGHFDLESTELHIRSSMQGFGSIMLEEILNSDNGGYQGRAIGNAQFKEYRHKKLQTVLGYVSVTRAYYYNKRDFIQSGIKKNYGKSWGIQAIWSWT